MTNDFTFSHTILIKLDLIYIKEFMIQFNKQEKMKPQTFLNSSDRAGRKSQGPTILPSMPVRVSDKNFCFAPEIGNATGMPERSRLTRN